MSDCVFVTWHGSHFEPAEYCIELAEPGSEYCIDHNPDRWEPDWDDIRKDSLYDCE